jgi:hypothetical protein
MDRALLTRAVAVAMVALALLGAGCLRNEFDLCRGETPHPDCALFDAGRPDGGDAGSARDAATSDASTRGDAAMDGG